MFGNLLEVTLKILLVPISDLRPRVLSDYFTTQSTHVSCWDLEYGFVLLMSKIGTGHLGWCNG